LRPKRGRRRAQVAYDQTVSTRFAAHGPVRRAAIANLGCKVNQAEMDGVERLLRGRGVDLVALHEPADLIVINTCTVTSMADAKSRHLVRRARRLNPGAELLVTGCSVAVDPESLAAADPAARLYDNESKGRLLAEMAELVGLPDGVAWPTLSGVEATRWPGGAAGADGTGTAGADPDIDRAHASMTRAFIKIQDGCSFHCTYCIIPRARGSERSLPAEAVVGDVRRALAAGHREVVLTGINVGTYLDGDVALPGLVRRLLAETAVERIRLSSVEPQHVTDELLAVWAESGGRCLPHFHVPLQSGDDTILRRMGRRYDTAAYAAVVARIRATMPDAAIHADLIVGFPGEEEAAWSRTAAFMRGLDLAGFHVFRYSGRPGTPAARMVGQVDDRTKKRRAAEALAIAAEARGRFAQLCIGRETRVLFEVQLPDGRWLGHAECHVLVAAAAPDGTSLDNAIGLVLAESMDPAVPDRIDGRLLAADLPRVVSAAVLPVRAASRHAARRPQPGVREPLAQPAGK
jgi:threonylcarbamoyladenosine tRNA methylthiotransferase MtaB